MTKEYAIMRMEYIISNSACAEGTAPGSQYHLTAKANDWEKYGKNRTYLEIAETNEHSRHYVVRKYGYIDNTTGEYVPGKCNLNDNYKFSGALID